MIYYRFVILILIIILLSFFMILKVNSDLLFFGINKKSKRIFYRWRRLSRYFDLPITLMFSSSFLFLSLCLLRICFFRKKAISHVINLSIHLFIYLIKSKFVDSFNKTVTQKVMSIYL